MARKKSRVEKSVFDSQMEQLERQAATRQRQRRNQEREASRTTVYVYKDQWKLLERRAAQSKTDTNDGINRAEVVRALIDFFLELKPNLKQVSSEEELVEALRSSAAKKSSGT